MSDSVKAAYETPDDYEVRARTHALYSIAKQSWFDWLFEQLPREAIHTVLDVGCGTGELMRRIAAAGIGERWLGVDQSAGMVRKAKLLAEQAGLSVEYRCGDIMELSRAGEGFDLICACHMLYHVPDINAAIGRCVKCLSTTGIFVATTNSRESMVPYLDAAWSAVKERFPQVSLRTGHLPFTLENGTEFLMRHFDCIELRVWRDAFRFPHPEPWATYLKSGRYIRMPEGHRDEEWAEAAKIIDRVAAEQCKGDTLIVPKVTGMFLCSKPV